jgi:MFS family permease
MTGLGDGLWFTVWAIYLTHVKGIPAEEMGLGMGAGSVLGLAAVVPFGVLADRFGPKGVLVLLCGLRAAAAVAFLWVDGFWPLLLAATLAAGAQSSAGGVRITLVYKLIHADTRLRVLARSRVVQHIAYALGGLAGGTVLGLGTPALFAAALLFTGGAYLVASGLTALVPHVEAVPRERRHGATRALRDGPFLAIMLATAPLTLCWAMLSTGLPLWVYQATVAPAWTSAFAVVVSSLAIAMLQVRFTDRAARTVNAVRAARWSGLALALACVLFAAGAWPRDGVLAFAVLALGVVAMFVGELYFVSSRWGLSLRLMAADAEGQYQGVVATTESAVSAVGPAIITALLAGAGGGGWYILGAVILIPVIPVTHFTHRALRTRNDVVAVTATPH